MMVGHDYELYQQRQRIKNIELEHAVRRLLTMFNGNELVKHRIYKYL